MELKAILRDTKKNPKQYLKEGYVPAELYGKGIENIHVSESKRIYRCFEGGGRINNH